MHSTTVCFFLLTTLTTLGLGQVLGVPLRGSRSKSSTHENGKDNNNHVMQLMISSSLFSSSSSSSSSSITTPYDDLLNCMWNGTTVAVCHSLQCKWCHSSFTDICVTTKYANQLDGAIFTCETSPPSTDDDAVPPPETDDALAPTAPAPTAPTSPAPSTTPDHTDDDSITPVDDDDPNHAANAKYMEHLLHCMALVDMTACTKDPICTICHHATTSSLCFSHQAARQMEGAYYTCDMQDGETELQEMEPPTTTMKQVKDTNQKVDVFRSMELKVQ